MDIEDIGKWNTHAFGAHCFKNATEVTSIQSSLLTWYATSRRKLPWRGDGADGTADPKLIVSPYATWVSEIMLQQTRVEAVITVSLLCAVEGDHAALHLSGTCKY